MDLLMLLLVVMVSSVVMCDGKPTKTFADYIGGDQFLFVGLSNCHLTTEANPQPGMCPYHTVYQTSTYNTEPPCSKARLHLWLMENAQPRALVLAPADNGFTIARLNKIRYPLATTEQFSFRCEPLDLTNPADFPFKVEFSKIAWTLYDTYYRLLYVVRNNTALNFRNVECIIFVVNFYGNNQIGFSKLGQIDVHPNNDLRSLWAEDPYQRKFYYAVKEGDETGVFSIPYSKLSSVLASGQPGNKEATFPDPVSYFSVSRGIVVSYTNHSGKVFQLTKNLKNTKGRGVACEMRSGRSRLSSSLALSMIFDLDYCLVRDDGKMASNCTHVINPSQSSELLVETNQGVCSISDAVYWLLAVIFILCCFVLVLSIHAWRTRERIDETFLKAERPRIHYYPTFISDPSIGDF